MSECRVRIRGIYATGLTVYLRANGISVVDPSPTVADRIGDVPTTGLPNARVESTEDGIGIEISGEPAAVETVAANIESLSSYSFRWSSALPRGAVRSGRVHETGESGAVITIGDDRAFLPYSRSEAYVTEGDRVSVQVIDTEPPWSPDRRPVVTTEPRVLGTYLSIVRDPDRPSIDAPNRELHGMVELLDPTLPEEWSLVVRKTAQNLELDVLSADLERMLEQRETVEHAMQRAADPADPGGAFVPERTEWHRLGRQSRFELDDYRERCVPTMDGHHRLKAAGRAAGMAVEYLEQLDSPVPFDLEAALCSFGPSIGDRIRIHHGKPTGETIVLGRGVVIDHPRSDAVRVRRELTGGGTLDGIGVPKEDGDIAETTFVEGQRWSPTVYRDAEGTRKGTYVNIGTPLEIFPNRVSYVDLYIDVVKDRSGDVRIIDQDELSAAVNDGDVSEAVATEARELASTLVRSVESGT